MLQPNENILAFSPVSCKNKEGARFDIDLGLTPERILICPSHLSGHRSWFIPVSSVVRFSVGNSSIIDETLDIEFVYHGRSCRAFYVFSGEGAYQTVRHFCSVFSGLPLRVTFKAGVDSAVANRCFNGALM